MGCYERLFASSVEDLRKPKFYVALLGEMMGVMFLVLVACSTPYGEPEAVRADQTRISLGFGLSVATMVWVLANVSGGHINPAVTTGMLVARKISLIKFLLYIVFQSLGGILGSALQKALTCGWQVRLPNTTECGLGMTTLGNGVSPIQGFVIELLITIVLVITVFATCDKSRSDLAGSGPLAIGLSVTVCHLAFGYLTGPSMNPARSFGPAVMLGYWENHWVYWCGPIIGGVIAALMYEFLFAGNAAPAKMASWLQDSDYEVEADRSNGDVYELKRDRSPVSSNA